MRVIVSGVPGVGKSTVLRFLKTNMKIMNFGDVMVEVSGCSDRDEMREKVRPEEYRRIQLKAARKIGKMNDVIIDTHLSILSEKGFYPGIPLEVAKHIKPDVIIILEKDPRKIREQAIRDKTRKRNYTLSQIREHQEMNRIYGVALSTITSCFLKIIKIPSKEAKPFDGSRKAAKEIEKVIEKWMSYH